MARHRKSPHSRRNLMVIDPLTPSQGHQFDHRLKFFSLSWSTAHPLKFDMPQDHVQKIDFLTSPQGPRGWGPKKLCWCMCNSCKIITHQIWLYFVKKNLTPQPPMVPPSPTPGHDPGARMKILSDMLYIFHL